MTLDKARPPRTRSDPASQNEMLHKYATTRKYTNCCHDNLPAETSLEENLRNRCSQVDAPVIAMMTDSLRSCIANRTLKSEAAAYKCTHSHKLDLVPTRLRKNGI